MNESLKNRIAEKRWEIERNEKLNFFMQKISSTNLNNKIENLGFVESDEFQKKSEEWPNKYVENLYFQIELNNVEEISKRIQNYLDKIETDYLYIFLMNFNFGLLKIEKSLFLTEWNKILEIDNDEIFCFNPLKTDFICIEKTEEYIIGKENEGQKWICEITYSNKNIMN
ncbi:hypothetical protein [Flavobacterium sp. GP15]|uniref:hypothetical protein n=1 Tax=Flavobacterium sp. GP15 TaxID=2758567 RepID=UPI00165E7662|nr:hypothetical protein [Flavobacterium sp. GP15]